MNNSQTTSVIQGVPEAPAFAYRDADYFFRKKHLFFGRGQERNVFLVLRDASLVTPVIDKLRANNVRNDDIFLTEVKNGSTMDDPLKIVSIAPMAIPAGIVLGHLLGSILGVLSHAGLLTFFGIAPFAFADAWQSAIASGTVGSFVGGILGAVYGMRIPEYQTARYTTEYPEGTVFLVVRADNEEQAQWLRTLVTPFLDERAAPILGEEVAA